MTQNNRGNVLRDLASSPDEDRRAACSKPSTPITKRSSLSSRYRPARLCGYPEQRGNVLSDLASSPDEDRRARLLEALHAYNEALKFRRPDTAPLAYAATRTTAAMC